MASEFLNLLYYLILSILFSIVLVLSAILIVARNYDVEKNSAYECGFHPFEDTRSKFDVRFYLVAILFIIFDLEVALLFPWLSTFTKSTGFFEVSAVLFFLYLLLIGFYYEWQKGSLEWE